MALPERGTWVGRLRIRAAAEDELALRMRSERALRPLDLIPPGMPAPAIFCVRTMADPLPGGIDVRTAHAGRAGAWEHAARHAIGNAWRGAVRAGDETAGAAAAVLFADRAELLAAAAADAVHGRLGRWYWRNLLAAPTLAAVVREWQRAPLYVPAALQLLAEAGGAAAFAQRLSDAEALDLVRASAAPVAGALATVGAAPAADCKAVEPPWIHVVPEARHPALTARQRLFLGVILTLRRAPTLACSTPFARAAAEWLVPQTARPRHPDDPVEEPARANSGSAPAAAPPAAAGLGSGAQPPASGPAVGRDAGGEGAPESGPGATEAARQPLAFLAAQPAPAAGDRVAVAAGPELPAPLVDRSVASDYAGVFFLFNLSLDDDDGELLALLSADGPDAGAAIDPWDLLAVLGRGLAAAPSAASGPRGVREGGFEDDPVWPLLAVLAGRPEGQPPGAGFIPPGGRSFDIWVAGRLAGARARLASLLPVADPAAFLLRRPGRIGITPAHVDVTFALADHPIEIRLAGLDRNPGWVPAAGRHVAFHFD